MQYPSVREFSISDNRIQRIRGELHNSMGTYSVIRRILRPVRLKEEPSRADRGEFTKIGISEIIDKIWYVDGAFETGVFSVSGIGTSYALGFAKTETAYLMNSISQATKQTDRVIKYSTNLKPETIYEAANVLRDRGFDPNLVFTNVRDHVFMWQYHPTYYGFGRRTFLKMMGHSPCRVDFAPEVPEGTSYVLDRKRFGALVLKQDLDISVTPIPTKEHAAILEQLPELKGEDLREKVRVIIQEVVRIDIDDANAIVPIRRH